MKKEIVSGDVKTFQGASLPEPVSYKGEYEEFETVQECKSAGEWPSETDIVKMVNNDRKMSARAKATVIALDRKYEETKNPVYKKLDQSTPEGQRENLIKAILKANPKFSRDRAEKMADSMVAAE